MTFPVSFLWQETLCSYVNGIQAYPQTAFSGRYFGKMSPVSKSADDGDYEDLTKDVIVSRTGWKAKQ